jgi:hypothetical protein
MSREIEKLVEIQATMLPIEIMVNGISPLLPEHFEALVSVNGFGRLWRLDFTHVSIVFYAVISEGRCYFKCPNRAAQAQSVTASDWHQSEVDFNDPECWQAIADVLVLALENNIRLHETTFGKYFY